MTITGKDHLMRATMLGVVVALVLAGCGAEPDTQTSSAPPATTVAATPTPTATPSPTAMTTEQAAAHYVAASTPSNEASAAFNTEARKESPALRKLQARATTAADATAAFMKALQNPPAPWPAEVSSFVDQIEADLAAEITPWRQIAAAQSIDDINAVPFPEFDNGPSQQLRAILGLPEPPLA